LTQAQRYDEKGEYVKLWCPELAQLPPDWVHRPDQLTPQQQNEFGVKIGGHYPKAIVPTQKWMRSKKGKNRGNHRSGKELRGKVRR
ncbi:MAG: FAD-binding domain-containing protein, partial [Bacteroidota bacterium]